MGLQSSAHKRTTVINNLTRCNSTHITNSAEVIYMLDKTVSHTNVQSPLQGQRIRDTNSVDHY